MHFHEVVLAKGFGAFEDSAGIGIDIAHFVLFLVRHGHHPEGEDFVDLEAVAKVAGALGCDLGIVVEDDRGREHRVAFLLLLVAHEDGPGADIVASGRVEGMVRGRIGE